MTDKKPKKDSPKMDQVLADIAQSRKLRENTYRARALKMFPWVCARCTREFSEKKVRELTVHHKDHDHDNNPALTAATGNFCVSTVTTTNTPSIQMQIIMA